MLPANMEVEEGKRVVKGRIVVASGGASLREVMVERWRRLNDLLTSEREAIRPVRRERHVPRAPRNGNI
jgi:hypothetical protein